MFSVLFAAALALSPVKQPTSVADPVLTPGLARTDLTLDQIKATKWGLDRRLVSARMKAEVYARYGFSGPHDPRCTPNPKDPRQTCEVDHRIPRCAGGADGIANLSPQPYGGDYNAHQKDRVEVRVCRMLIHDQIALTDAQAIFLGDWTVTYDAWFGGRTPERPSAAYLGRSAMSSNIRARRRPPARTTGPAPGA